MRRLLAAPLFVLSAALAVPAAPPAGVSRPLDPDAARRSLGLLPDYATAPRLKNVTVAVLDSGFAGFDGKRPHLPPSAVLVEDYDPDWVRRAGLGDPAFKKPLDPANPHGRLMAQLVWATCGSPPDGPRFLLLNANGPTLFRRAVWYAVEQRADVILFSGTFEGAGNYDGRGPINAAVTEAVAAGAVWVNAAGNGGGMAYNGPVPVQADGRVQFAGSPSPTALRLVNRLDESPVTVTLTWNDYRDEEDAGTDKDLDLVVEDAAGAVVGEGKLRQVPAGRAAADGESKNPRERVVIPDLPAGEYRIRVTARGGTFGPADRLRVLVSAARVTPVPDPKTGKSVPPVELLDATPGGEIYPPADHPGVLTVGDGSRASAVGPTADGRVKPDVVVGSSVARFTNGEESAGSSNAAAYFAGVAAVLKAQEPGLTAAHLRAWVRRLDAAAAGRAGGGGPPAGGGDGAVVLTASPNQQRALRYVEGSMTDNRRAPGLRPLMEVSGPGGTVRIGGPADVPPAAARGQVPAAEPPPAPLARRAPPPHAAWVSPPPRALAELVRGR